MLQRVSLHGLSKMKANISTIVAGLRSAIGRHVPIVGMNVYDPLLGDWLAPGTGRSLAVAAVAGVGLLSKTMDQSYHADASPIADVQEAYHSADLTHFGGFKLGSRTGVGGKCLHVARYRVSSGSLIGYGDDPNLQERWSSCTHSRRRLVGWIPPVRPVAPDWSNAHVALRAGVWGNLMLGSVGSLHPQGPGFSTCNPWLRSPGPNDQGSGSEFLPATANERRELHGRGNVKDQLLIWSEAEILEGCTLSRRGEPGSSTLSHDTPASLCRAWPWEFETSSCSAEPCSLWFTNYICADTNASGPYRRWNPVGSIGGVRLHRSASSR